MYISRLGSYECKIPEGIDVDGKLILDWLSQLSEQLNSPNATVAPPPTTAPGNDTFGINSNETTTTSGPTPDPWDITFTPPTTISIPTLPPDITGPFVTPSGGNGTGDNGGAEISGDPHAMVWTKGVTPICFNFFGDDHRFVDLLR